MGRLISMPSSLEWEISFDFFFINGTPFHKWGTCQAKNAIVNNFFQKIIKKILATL